jgi:hypothetical protein
MDAVSSGRPLIPAADTAAYYIGIAADPNNHIDIPKICIIVYVLGHISIFSTKKQFNAINFLNKFGC